MAATEQSKPAAVGVEQSAIAVPLCRAPDCAELVMGERPDEFAGATLLTSESA